MTKKKPKARPRIRRTAENARAEILDAAERQLRAVGPSALRLQEIAREAGLSHPTVLHHFGSREALVEAVVERASESLQRDLMQALSTDDVAKLLETPHAVFDLVARLFGEQGHARLLAWLALSGMASSGDVDRQSWSDIIDAAHAIRANVVGERDPPLSRDDTAFAVIAAFGVLFSEALLPVVFENAGLDTAKRARFRPWVAEMIADRLVRS